MTSKLVPVTRATQLYSGMPLVARPVLCCKKFEHVFFLDREMSAENLPDGLKPSDFDEKDFPYWTVVGFPHDIGGWFKFLPLGIPMKEKRLFRLYDDSESIIRKIVRDVAREMNSRSAEIEAAYLERLAQKEKAGTKKKDFFGSTSELT